MIKSFLNGTLFKKITLLVFGISDGISFFFFAVWMQYKFAESLIIMQKWSLLSLALMPFSIKFIYPFIIDSFKFRLAKKLNNLVTIGIISSLISILGIIVISVINPIKNLEITFFIIFFTSIFSCMHNSVFEFYRLFWAVEIGLENGSTFFTGGFRLGYFFVAGLLPFLINVSNLFYATFTLLLLKALSIIFFILIRDVKINESAFLSSSVGNSFFSKNFFINVKNKMLEIFRNEKIFLFILSIFMIKISDVITGPIHTALLGRMHFSLFEFSSIKGAVGFFAIFLGIICGKFLSQKIKIVTSIKIGITLQSFASLFSFMLLHFGKNNKIFLLCTITEDFCSSLMNILLMIYISSSYKSNIYYFTTFSTISSFSRIILTYFFGCYLDKLIIFKIVFILPIVSLIPALLIINKSKTMIKDFN